MRAIFLALLVTVGAPIAATAQELIGSYYAMISPQDRVNSAGAHLSTIGAILQQDRANVHRFGRADQGDQSDWIFGNAAHRARIPDIWAMGPSGHAIQRQLASGRSAYIYVEIYGSGSVPLYILVHEGAG